MTMPNSREIIPQMLQYLAQKKEPVKLAKIIEDLAERFGLTDEERKERVESGGNRFRSRINIAISKMKSSRLLSIPDRGHLAITEKGREEIGDISPPVEESVGSSLNPPPGEEAQEPGADTVVSDNNEDDFYKEVVKIYLSKNEVSPEQLPDVLKALRNSSNVQRHIATPSASPAPSLSSAQATSQEPAVPIEDSVAEEHIICLECGKPFVSLKRHLGSHHLTTPEKYREKWGLEPDYPMITAKFSEERKRQRAINIGLEQKRQATKNDQS